jgi:hypothetical protein
LTPLTHSLETRIQKAYFTHFFDLECVYFAALRQVKTHGIVIAEDGNPRFAALRQKIKCQEKSFAADP